MVSPQVKRQAVDVLREERGFGVTRACGLLGISRSLYGYRSCRPVPAGLCERICELAGEKRRYGYRRIRVLLRRESERGHPPPPPPPHHACRPPRPPAKSDPERRWRTHTSRASTVASATSA